MLQKKKREKSPNNLHSIIVSKSHYSYSQAVKRVRSMKKDVRWVEEYPKTWHFIQFPSEECEPGTYGSKKGPEKLGVTWVYCDRESVIPNQKKKRNNFKEDLSLREYFENEDVELRLMIVKLSGKRRAKEVVAHLYSRLKNDSSSKVRMAAAVALGEIGLTSSIRHLEFAWKNERNSQVKIAIALALEDILDFGS